jgi:hypothetical protein
MKVLLTSLALSLASASVPSQDAAPRPAAATLSAPKGASQSDARGFIHRWLILEPVPVAGRLTEPAVREALEKAPIPGPANGLPRDGDAATIADTAVRWHALDTSNYNVNLYHFAWSLSKPTSNVFFWVTTTVDSPREMQDVRLAIGSNAASRWWLNDQPVIALNDDRQAVIDDGVSKRVTLKQGRNVIRAAIINGGGATDFCARFLDSNDKPIPGLTVSLSSP